ncbi:MAG: SpoIIE family protein phosphatase [Prolixibacteraceae bacterium]|nr:SpoIIE family protein phosphatase [Prolixibacteraceae bacterium]
MPDNTKKNTVKRGLAYKLIIYIFTGIAIIFALIFLYNYSYSKKIVEKNLRMNAKNLTGKGVAQIEKILSSIQKIPDNYSLFIESSDFSKEGLVKILKQELELNPEIFGAAIALEPYFYSEQEKYFMAYYFRGENGIELKYMLDDTFDYFTMDWYQIPKELNRPDWSEPYYDEGAGEIIMSTYSVPIYRNNNGKPQFAGILTADISLNWLEKFVMSINVYETGYGLVLSKNGKIITHPVKSLMMNESIFSIAEAQNLPQLREIGKSMVRGDEGMAEVEYHNQKNGKLSWISYAPIKLNGWSIALIFPVEEFMADVNGLALNLFVLCLGGLSIILVIIILISRSITLPLRQLSRVSQRIAKGNFQVKLPEIKSKDELRELHNSFAYMQEKLSEYIMNLKETTSAREKIESELRIAREIQLGMIPHTFPPFPELSEIDIFATLKPAREVGGDLYDFFLLDNNRLCFAIGDVSGKGVPASLLMAVTRALLRSVADKDTTSAAMVSSLNKSLSSDNESSMFVTFFAGILNMRTGELEYTNAGHNPPVVIRNTGEVEMLEMTKCIPIGLFEDFIYTGSTWKLNKGDKFFLYTDGVTEAENSEMELYTEKRLMEILTANYTTSPIDLIHALEKDISLHVDSFPQSDDITMMAIIFNG